MVNYRLALIIAILTLVGCSSPYNADSPARLDDGIEVASPAAAGLRIERLSGTTGRSNNKSRWPIF